MMPGLCLCLLATGCVGSGEGETTPEQTLQSHEQPLNPQPVPGSYDPPNADLEDVAPHNFAVSVSPNAQIDAASPWWVEVTNKTSWDAEGDLRLFHSSEAGSTHLPPFPFAARAGERVRVEIPASRLQLPGEPFDFAGSLQILVESRLSNGEKADYIADRVFFHPQPGGSWRVYDKRTLHDDYGKGRLTARAHQVIDEASNADLNAEQRMQGNAPEFEMLNIDSEAVFFTSAKAQKVSDSPYFVHGVEPEGGDQ